MDEFIGTIKAFGFNFAPRGWAFCDGSLLPISQYSALFSLLGTQYGGDGRTTFGLPDLRGRVPMSQGTGPGLTNRKMGQKSGSEINILNTNQMPAHTHAIDFTGQNINAVVSIPCINDDGSTDESENNVFANHAGAYGPASNKDANLSPFNSAVIGSMNSGTQGANTPINNLQPFQVVNYCICLQGIFPSRS